jgi:hypothetical protein
MNFKILIVLACLAFAGISAGLYWNSSKKFVSLATPPALSASTDRAPANATQTTFNGSVGQAPQKPLSLDAAVKHWPRFPELLRASQHPGYFIERKSTDYWIIAIGDKQAVRFHRWDMLRVWKTGLIERVDVATGTWIPEYRPGV